MDGKCFRRALLAAALGWGVWAGLARADAPLTPAPAPTPAPAAAPLPATVVINGMVYSNTGVAAPSSGCAGSAAGQAEATGGHSLMSNVDGHRLATFWQDHKPHCCWTHFNNYSCSTAASEYAFFFGSCRNFFGEACMGKPDPAFPGEQPPKNFCPNCHHSNP